LQEIVTGTGVGLGKKIRVKQGKSLSINAFITRVDYRGCAGCASLWLCLAPAAPAETPASRMMVWGEPIKT
jgi:hypothetical protein